MISNRLISAFALIFLLSSCDHSVIDNEVNLPLESIPQIQNTKQGVVETNAVNFSKATYADADDTAYDNVVRFDKAGFFYWNNMQVSLGDPIQHWINIVGEPSRSNESGTYLWDDLGVTVYTAGSDVILNDPTLNGTVSGFVVSFDDRYDDLGQYDIGRDPGGRPIGYFTGLIRFGDAWIDRERKVSEFLDYESTRTLEDSFDRSLVFRDIFDNENGEKIYFSITQGLSRAFPEGPDNVSASIIR